jgi:hypothetical protein
MLDLFSSVKKLLKVSDIQIDNNVFKLHYKATSIIYAIASILVTARSMGDPIHCMEGAVHNENMDIYCWTHGKPSKKHNFNIIGA